MKKQPGASLKRAFNIKSRQVSDFKKRNRIGGDNLDDLYRFKLRSPSNKDSRIDITLSKLKRNADLTLYSLKRKPRQVNKAIGKFEFSGIKKKDIRKNLKIVGRSKRKGNQEESISATLKKGTYYIRISSKSPKKTRYTLKLEGNSNTPPILSTNLTGSSRGGDTLTIIDDLLNATDREDDNQSLVYTLTKIPQVGRLELGGNRLRNGDQFTQQDISNGYLRYISLGSITQVTNNQVNDIASGISGSEIVFNRVNAASDAQVSDNLNDQSREVYLYNVGQRRLIQVTNNNIPDFPTGISGTNTVGNSVDTFLGQPAPSPFFYNGNTRELITLKTGSSVGDLIGDVGFPPVIKGDSVVWSAFADLDIDFEVFFYDVAAGSTTQLTRDAVNQIAVDVAGNNVLWNTTTGLQGQPDQVFWYNGSTQETKQVSQGTETNSGIGISDSTIAWTGSDGNDLEIFSYDIATGVTTQITNNDVDDVGVQGSGLSGKNIVWSRIEGDDADVFFYNGSSGETRQLTDTDTGEAVMGISGSNVIWSNFTPDDKVDEVFFYNGTRGITTQVTDSDNSNFAVAVSETKLVWNSFDGNDMEVFFADLGSFPASDRFGFTVKDSQGANTNGTFTISII